MKPSHHLNLDLQYQDQSDYGQEQTYLSKRKTDHTQDEHVFLKLLQLGTS